MTSVRAHTQPIIVVVVTSLFLIMKPSPTHANSLTGCGGFNFVDTLFKIRATIGSDHRFAFLLGKKWRIDYKYDEDERLFSCEYRLVDDAFKTANPEGCRDYAGKVKAEIEKQREITLLGIPQSARIWEETYKYPNGSGIEVMFDWREEQDGCSGRIIYVKNQNGEGQADPVTF